LPKIWLSSSSLGCRKNWSYPKFSIK